ncbi:hypothetical protein RRG08_051259 [Elysia crispata]|uniref:Uncharacterized protein n=1 Tax=Elysia crispata TaxID=231223 RepID=A0AAE1A6I0_9GAST|nr:hypothetical protein RRG08_051259 [Elysia crispata]
MEVQGEDIESFSSEGQKVFLYQALKKRPRSFLIIVALLGRRFQFCALTNNNYRPSIIPLPDPNIFCKSPSGFICHVLELLRESPFTQQSQGNPLRARPDPSWFWLVPWSRTAMTSPGTLAQW